MSFSKPNWLLAAGMVFIMAAGSVYARANITYGYDALGRVISATYPDGTVVGYAYDVAGNRTQVSTTGGPNHNPTPTTDSKVVAKGGVLTFDPRTNDTDPDVGDTLTIGGATGASHGSLSNTTTGVTYTPASTYVGTDTFSYTLADNHGATATGTVNVFVNSTPDAVNDTATAAAGVATTLNPLSNDTEEDGDSLTITAVTTPGHGTATISGTTIVYAASGSYSGSDSFNYTITDAHGATDTATVSITVSSSNHNPSPTTDNKVVAKGGVLSFDPRTNDSDPDAGDTLTIAGATGALHGTLSYTTTGLTYTPTSTYVGTDTFSYTLADNHGATAIGTVNVFVNSTPDAVNDTATTNAGSAATVSVLANDTEEDGDTLSISSASTPGHGTTSISGSTVIYTPTGGYSGSDSFTYTITDTHGATDTATVSVTVNSVALTAVADSFTVIKSTTTTGYNPRTNDLNIGSATITSVTQAAHVTVSITNSGTTLSLVAANYTGNDSFTYTVSDGTTSSTATVSLFVNTRPTVTADSYTVVKDTPQNLYVMSNDSDVNGDSFNITAKGSGPSHGTAVIASGGTYITYTPTTGYTGSDSFYYTVTDSRGATANATVTITVALPSNHNPVAMTDSQIVAKAGVLTFDPRTNDTDPDSGDTLSVTSATGASHGTLSYTSTSVTYTPTSTYVGADSFTYTISDGHGGTATGTVNVFVNSMPDAVNDTATASAATPTTISPLTNDTEQDGDALTISAVSTPGHGAATISGSTIVYTSTSGYSGSDSFTYTITDTHGASDTATVTVTVSSNHAPAAMLDSQVLAKGSYVTFDPRTNDSDPDSGDTLSITGAAGATNGTLSYTSTSVTYTPTSTFAGADSFTYTLSDNHGATTTGTVNVFVNSTPDAINDSATAVTAVASTINPLGNDTDQDGDSFSITSVSAPSHGTATISGASIIYTSASGYSGTDSFTYTITDPHGSTDTATVTVTVSGATLTAVDDTLTVIKSTTTTGYNPKTNDLNLGSATITSVTQMTHGTISITGSGTTLQIVAANYTGYDSFTYTLTAGSTTSTATVTVFVNTRPAVIADSYTVPLNTAQTLYVMSNDSDVNGDTFTITAKGSGPSHGTAVINPGGAYITYTPTTGYSGPDSFYYTVTDSRGATANATVTITVNTGGGF